LAGEVEGTPEFDPSNVRAGTHRKSSVDASADEIIPEKMA
jgi:hypothetical protein